MPHHQFRIRGTQGHGGVFDSERIHRRFVAGEHGRKSGDAADMDVRSEHFQELYGERFGDERLRSEDDAFDGIYGDGV